MVALARDLNIFAPRLATSITAVLFATSYIAQTGYVRTLSHRLICHLQSFHISLSFRTFFDRTFPIAPFTIARELRFH